MSTCLRFQISLLLAVLVLTGTQPATAQESGNDSQSPQLQQLPFDEFKGIVTDTKGRAIDAYVVTIRLFRQKSVTADSPGGVQQTQSKHQWEFKGDGESKGFVIPVGELADEFLTGNRSLSLSITAKGFLPHAQWFSIEQTNGNFQKTKLRRGIKIKGKLEMPAGQVETPVERGVLMFTEKSKSNFGQQFTPNNRFYKSTSAKENGEFELVVPESCTVSMSAYSDNAATITKQIKIKRTNDFDDIQDLGIIRLAKGESISGVVRDLDGNPVPGEIIQLKKSLPLVGNFQGAVDGFAQSDAQGRFTLPPRAGKVELSLVKFGRIDGRRVTNDAPLPAPKVTVNITPGKEPEFVEITEKPTWKVHGSINVSAVEIASRSHILYSSLSGMNGQFESISLNSDDEFQFEIVEGESFSIWIIAQSLTGSMYFGKLSEKSFDKFSSKLARDNNSIGQHFQFKPIKGDIGPLEFELVAPKVLGSRTPIQMFFDMFDGGE